MSTNGGNIAVRPPRAVGNPDASELDTLTRMGKLLAASGFCKGARNEAQAVALILMGREMGLPAMQALSTIHVIEGRPTAGVHLLGAMLARGGVTWEVVEHSDTTCRLRFHRDGWPAPIESAYTMEDAKRAGLAGKNTWRSYPRQMLYARAFTEGARSVGPDLLCGVMYTPEELGAQVDGDGDVIDVSARTATPVPVPAVTTATSMGAAEVLAGATVSVIDVQAGARSPEAPAEPAPPPASDALRARLDGIEACFTRFRLVGHYRKHYAGRTRDQLGLTADEVKIVNAALDAQARDFGIAGTVGLKRLAAEDDARTARADAAPADAARQPGDES